MRPGKMPALEAATPTEPKIKTEGSQEAMVKAIDAMVTKISETQRAMVDKVVDSHQGIVKQHGMGALPSAKSIERGLDAWEVKEIAYDLAITKTNVFVRAFLQMMMPKHPAVAILLSSSDEEVNLLKKSDRWSAFDDRTLEQANMFVARCINQCAATADSGGWRLFR